MSNSRLIVAGDDGEEAMSSSSQQLGYWEWGILVKQEVVVDSHW